MPRWPLWLLILPLLACKSMLAPAAARWPALPDGHFMHVGDYLQVSGTGAAAGAGDTERKAVAREAAVLDAWGRLRGYVDALPLPDGYRVLEKAAASEEYDAAINRLVQRAAVVQTQFTVDGTAVVILRIAKPEINRALGTRFQ